MQIDEEGMASWYQAVAPLSSGWYRISRLNLEFLAPYCTHRRWRLYYLGRDKHCFVSELPGVRLPHLAPTNPFQCHRLHKSSTVLSQCFRILLECRFWRHVHKQLRRTIFLGSLVLCVECSCLCTASNCSPCHRLRTKILYLDSTQLWLVIDLEPHRSRRRMWNGKGIRPCI